jgi:hypothetical protein
MKIGTKSVLFGVHCFLIHPIFVFIAWWKLYGFPFDPRLWVAFFVHDIGYLEKPNMDGKEGETHVELGAKIMAIFDYQFMIKNIHHIYFHYPKYTRLGYKMIFAYKGYVLAKRNTKKWSDFSKYHSRFYAKKDNKQPSKLCIADKLAICITPTWLYLFQANLTGEIKEYMACSYSKEQGSGGLNAVDKLRLTSKNQKEWITGVKLYMHRWVILHKDGKEDTWTPNRV